MSRTASAGSVTPAITKTPALSIDALGIGRTARKINGTAVVHHKLGSSHSILCSRAESPDELRLFVRMPVDVSTPPLRKLAMSGYVVATVSDRSRDEIFLCIKASKARNTIAFRGVVTYLVEELSKDSSKRQTWERVCEALKEYRKSHSQTAHVGLSEHELVGLYGELYVMKEILMPAIRDWDKVLSVWKGYLAEKQDFVGQDWLLEVKANRAKKAECVWINGVAQLRSIPNKRFFLCHLHFDRAEEGGQGITKMIDSIKDQLPTEKLRSRFDSALMDAGYDEDLAIEWDTLLFQQPDVTFYDVLKQGTPYKFPRVTEVDSSGFIIDLKYKLLREKLEPFIESSEEFVKCVRGLE